MKPSSYLCVCLLSALSGALCASLAAFEAKDVPVTEVTMYWSSGQIRREVTWKDAAEGEHLLQFRGLPIELDESTFSVKASGEMTVIDTAVAARTISPEEIPELQVQSLRDRHNEMALKLVQMEQEEKRLHQKIDLVKDFGKSFLQMTTNQDSATLFAALKELLKLSDESMADTYDQRGKLEHERKQLKKQADDLEKEIAKLMTDKRNIRQVKDITLRVHIPSTVKAPLHIQVEYHQYGCSWQPEYEIKVSSGNGGSHASMPLSIEYFARIKQSSYEDWDNVRLTLATNAPHQMDPPPLYSKYVGPHAPAEFGFMPKQAMFRMDVAASVAAGGAMMEASYEAAEINSVGVLGAYTFTVAGGVNVASSILQKGHNHMRVFVDTIQLNGTPFVWSVPDATETAFFQLLCKNSRTLPILGSRRANVYFDGVLVAQTTLSHTPVGEVFVLNLSEDRGVKVTHRPLKITSNTDGIISKTRTRPYDTLTTITNQNAHPQIVIVGQAVPKSETSKIQVELVKPNPADLQPLAAKSTRSLEDEIRNMLQDMGTKAVKDKATLFHYVSKASNIVYSVAILSPEETINVPLEYKVIWPDSMGEIDVQSRSA